MTSGPVSRRSVAAAAVIAVTMMTGLWGQGPEGGRRNSADDWQFVGGDRSSSRHSTLTDINTDTIDRLGGAWATRLEGGASSRATPVIQDGVMYLTAGANVFAIDAKTGETIWRWQSDDPDAPIVPAWQGVGLGEGLVFIGARSAAVAALGQDTGELVWVASIGNDPGYIGELTSTAPLFVGGKVFAGMGSGDWVDRARWLPSMQRRARSCGPSRSFHVRASSVTTPGRKTTTLGSSVAVASGSTAPRIPTSSWSTS